jgi:hypothetical protein
MDREHVDLQVADDPIDNPVRRPNDLAYRRFMNSGTMRPDSGKSRRRSTAASRLRTTTDA